MEASLRRFRSELADTTEDFYGSSRLVGGLTDVDEQAVILDCLRQPLTRCSANAAEDARAVATVHRILMFLEFVGVDPAAIDDIKPASLGNAPSSTRKNSLKTVRSALGKKVHIYSGHHFVATHYNKPVFCHFCKEMLWGFGNQGYECQFCGYAVHKRKCVTSLTEPCSGMMPTPSEKPEEGADAGANAASAPASGAAAATASSATAGESGPGAAAATPGADKRGKGKLKGKRGGSKVVIDVEAAPDSGGERRSLKEEKAAGGAGNAGDRNSAVSTGSGGSGGGFLSAFRIARSGSSLGDREKSKSLESLNSLTVPDGDGAPASPSSGKGSAGGKGSKGHNKRKSDLSGLQGPSAAASKEERRRASLNPTALSSHPKAQTSSATSLNELVAVSETQSDTSSIGDLSQVSSRNMTATCWSLSVPPEVVEGTSHDEIKRQEGIFELIQTEQNYVNDLDIILNVFAAPLRKHLSKREYDTIFGNVDELFRVHSELMGALMQRQEESGFFVSGVGDIFLAKVPEMRVYALFCSRQQRALQLLRLLGSTKQIAAVLEGAAENRRCRRLSLKDFMATPMQRLTRYPLLLEMVLKSTAPDHEDHKTVQQSIRGFKDAASAVNHAVRRSENRAKLEQLQANLDFSPLGPDAVKLSIVNSNRIFICEGPLSMRIGRKMVKCIVFLFSDSVLITKKADKKFEVVEPPIALLELLIRNVETLHTKDQNNFLLVRYVTGRRGGRGAEQGVGARAHVWRRVHAGRVV